MGQWHDDPDMTFKWLKMLEDREPDFKAPAKQDIQGQLAYLIKESLKLT